MSVKPDSSIRFAPMTRAAKLEPAGQVEYGATIHQSGIGIIAAEVGRSRRGGIHGPSRRNPPPDDAFAIIGLEPIDARRLVRQAFPHRQEQTADHVDGTVGIGWHFGDFTLPDRCKAVASGFLPMAVFHHGEACVLLFHRPDQADATFDLAVVEHD